MKHNIKDYQALSINEAIDNLSTIAELDLSQPLGIIKNHKFVVQNEEVSYKTIDWLSLESSEEVFSHIQETFKAILSYLKDLYEDPAIDWNDKKTKKGLQALMVLVGEAANKLEQYLVSIRKMPANCVKEFKEFKELQNFYRYRISPKVEGGLEGAGSWQEDWVQNEESLSFDLAKRGLKDFETVKKDREYELFYLRDDDEKLFFSPKLLRNIKLYCDFDEITPPLEEDPLLKIRGLRDKDLQAAAEQIFYEIKPIIDLLYQEKKSFLEHQLAESLHKSLLALLLASNPKNLLQSTAPKSCIEYFEDFQHFLRQALRCEEYQKMIAYPEKYQDNFSKMLMQLAHTLCHALFCRKEGVKEEILGFIYSLVHKGEEKEIKNLLVRMSFWEDILEKDDAIRQILKFYPNGPLFKDLDVIRAQEEEFLSFDPMMQGNLPSTLYSFHFLDKKISVLRMACPTKQQMISEAKIVEEFVGFLRFNFAQKKKKHHLLINLQDKTSWKEYSRCHALEHLQAEAEIKDALTVISLTKDTDFYYQNAEYLELSLAKDFIDQFIQQIFGLDACGYFFPKHLLTSQFQRFIEHLFKAIHEMFFDKKPNLSRKNRLDFIEIAYGFMILKLLEMTGSDSISFTCKDGVDVGQAQATSFFAFLHLLSKDKWDKQSKDMLLWLLYAPALQVRERSIDTQRMNRIISAVAYVDELIYKNQKKFKKLFSPLFKENIFGIKGLL